MEHTDLISQNVAINKLLNVYCRLGKSEYGVGIFAIRLIPEGYDPFLSHREIEVVKISASRIKDHLSIHPEVKRLVKDMCVEDEEGFYYLPQDGLNELGIGWYLNHSKTPNMHTSDGLNFFTNREIKEGEELTVDYSTYGEENLE